MGKSWKERNECSRLVRNIVGTVIFVSWMLYICQKIVKSPGET